jgi:hypothetical protein
LCVGFVPREVDSLGEKALEEPALAEAV